MKNDIRIKLLLITLLTLTIGIGGTILYISLVEELKMEANNMNNEIYIISSPQIYSSGSGSGKTTSSYKLSGKSTSVQPEALDVNVKRDNSIISGVQSSGSGSVQSSFSTGRNIAKRNNKDGIFSSGTVMITQNQVSGRGSSTSSSYGSTAGSSSLSSAYSSGSGYLTTPMFANGLDGNPDDPSDEYPPPVGTPVGNGLWFMLALAGAYALMRRKN